MVKSPDPGIEIYVRNKRPADMTTYRPERTVLFVHGATYPAHTLFDLKLDDLSPMEYIAARGYDVYLLDIRGYGKSTRPKEMADKPDANGPIVRGDTAVKDIGTVVDFIRARRGIPRLNLFGWSWGTTLMSTSTTQNPNKVERLVLYAPGWIRQTASLVQAGPGPLGTTQYIEGLAFPGLAAEPACGARALILSQRIIGGQESQQLVKSSEADQTRTFVNASVEGCHE